MPEGLRSQFLLDPDIAFLNHGSFGACPKPVFDVYLQWQRTFESRPVEYHIRRAPELLRESRQVLAEYVNCDRDDLVYVTNATVAVNIVARSLNLKEGDEVLTVNHEYGACDRTWEFLRRKRGFTYHPVPIPVPVTTHQDLIERVTSQFRPNTKVLYVSHITSPTGLTLPLAELCRKAREHGIMTIVDGAHAVGQIPLDLTAIDPDFYTSNLHKWLCAPKGAAFLYARKDRQELLEPLVVSWGWEPVQSSGSTFIDHHEYQGTREIAAPLSVPTAIQFYQENDWNTVRKECYEMVRKARPEIATALDTEPIAPDTGEWFTQMSAFLVPEGMDGYTLKDRLYDEHKVEIPILEWNGRQTIRISMQGYNTWQDVEQLLEGIRTIRKTL